MNKPVDCTINCKEIDAEDIVPGFLNKYTNNEIKADKNKIANFEDFLIALKPGLGSLRFVLLPASGLVQIYINYEMFMDSIFAIRTLAIHAKNIGFDICPVHLLVFAEDDKPNVLTNYILLNYKGTRVTKFFRISDMINPMRIKKSSKSSSDSDE